ncbi:uncharacterized protein LOC123265832 [Cotesia glomerata]|uniref:Uncharacterized protein n=1 Tax=Cotesia glomerata TaxID=32391 RepID=A0AAV7IXY3_COTGL|nr:uncharacterized protein LOC123265832 [Cotesia glomerata]KAH0561632.1 hypothetical protein KQX54_018210 [Cotesia glomerata]
MSCLSALRSQILSFVSVPHEILSLRHKVLREYAKVLLGPDFSHTFPSFILITAVCVALKRCLSLRWLPVATNKTFLQSILQAAFSWVVINAALWYWLIIQRVLYCTVWNYWDDEETTKGNPVWWKKVWASYDPLEPEPNWLSPDFISWTLSMTLATFFYLFVIYVNYITYFGRNVIASLWGLITFKVFRQVPAKKIEEEDDATDKSEAGSVCDRCNLEISDSRSYNLLREESPVSYGKWHPGSGSSTGKNHRKMRNRRSPIRSSSSEKSTAR